MTLPDLSRYAGSLIGVDTETTGTTTKDVPVGISIATPDGFSEYYSWGQEGGGNNVTLREVREWAAVELKRPDITYVGSNLSFDLRMLAYVGVDLGLGIGHRGLGDTQVMGTLVNENRPQFGLDALAREAGIAGKNDQELNDWCAKQFGGRPTHKAQAKNYHKAPRQVIAPYAANDPVLSLKVHDWLLPQIKKEGVENILDMELRLLPILLKMHLVGVRADREKAEQMLDRLQDEKHGLLRTWPRLADEVSDNGTCVSRPSVIGPYLRELGINVPKTKGTPKRKPVDSVTKDWLEKLDHPIGAAIRRLRQIDHFSGTFIRGYILDNTEETDPIIHGEFHALKGDEYGTVSGRFSSGGDLNLQNIPARDEVLAPLVRGMFIPMNDGQQWWKIDYSQIEYRFFAHYAGCYARMMHKRGIGTGQSAMEQAYIDDPFVDFHDWVAKTANIKRKRAKNVNFCRLYGGGIPKIAATAGCSIEEATEFVAAYDAAIPEAKALMNDVGDRASSKAYIRTWQGRKARFMTEGQLFIRYQVPIKSNANRIARTHAALNRLLQGSAADLQKLAMIEVAEYIDWTNTVMSLTVHDELDGSTDKGAAGIKVVRSIKEIMQEVAKRPAWNGVIMQVPVVAEAELGPDWGHTEKLAA